MAICSTVEVPDMTDLNAMSEAWSPLVLTTANEIYDLGRTTGRAIDGQRTVRGLRRDAAAAP